MPAANNLAGRRYGRLLAVSRIGRRAGQATWLCRCDCGQVTVVKAGNLQSGNTKSCGCRKHEVLHVPHHNPNHRHGATVGGKTTPEYRAWAAMIQRCSNPRLKSYPDYGGRGITVCIRWKRSFAAFLADMGPRPSPKHSLHRVDNDSGYRPGNCAWATASEQAANKRPDAVNNRPRGDDHWTRRDPEKLRRAILKRGSRG